jgi:hypothetical protein
MTFCALGKLIALEKGPTIRKGIKLKNDGYNEKASTGSNYAQKRQKFEKWFLRKKGAN